ncbi:recombination mediator RecR [Aestuariispira ectoiniformans]|uniref:recombination mediator RecR n=1 Tax=Aestuariispira ectoiniformans TaxID=2775080 RepID=UPI00223AAF38|nr:recombination mediator RecR [Aestuariispira ectoiniformans]
MNEIDQLIQLLARLPGLGPRSARRAALQMVQKRESLMRPLADALHRAADSIRECSTCGNIDTQDPCKICEDPRRDETMICVVEQVGDLWALERTGSFKGRYHVLGGVLSALDGVGPEDLNIASLVDRVGPDCPVKEVILATNLTVDGQTTAHYVTERLADSGVRVSRLAHGVPVGGELDYLDDGTLSAALKSRQSLDG